MNKLFFLALILVTFLTIVTPMNSTQAKENQSQISAHNFTFDSAKQGQQAINLADYKDKVILVVNTASKCGFTNQYENMQNLHEQYADKGVVVIAVPSNDFGSQEPGSEAQICDFVEKQFNVTFPITAKYEVTGDSAHPFYKWARGHAGFIGSPKWNFHKYLIDKDGGFADWYS